MSAMDATAAQLKNAGRRVLFVDPPSVIQEQMIHFLVTAQYESAIVKDARRILPVLRAFPNSIVYFNIDSHQGGPALEQFVRSVVASRDNHGADVGILAYDQDEELARKYLMDIGTSCGFVTLNLGFKKSAGIIVRALEAAEARGERRFVRVKVPAGKGTFNLIAGGVRNAGKILDISEAGMAVLLDTPHPIGTYFADIQLQLWGSICRVAGTIRGTRQSPDGLVSVLMFDEITESTTRGKIYAFLKRVMQHEVDRVG